MYLLASALNGTPYAGVTSVLYDRMVQHRDASFAGFSKRYGVQRLVHYALHASMSDAIAREKRIKGWNRLWKIRLIVQMDPTWADLFDAVDGAKPAGPSGQVAGLLESPPSRG